jgi:Zn-dependent protease
MPTRQGSIRIFRLFGIDVYLHWYWLLFPFFGKMLFPQLFEGSVAWPVLEFLALFLIVLTHEFGHALACRQVGGKANMIVLWPLGGVAYVSPPQRPGAMLWSIAAGPLVNVALFPILSVFVLCGRNLGWPESHPQWDEFLVTVWFTNLVLLIFNLLPIYPLDGGQIFRSLLWFFMGRANSLMVASATGFVGVAAVALLAVLEQSWWFAIVAAFVGLNCWTGYRQATQLLRLEKAPRRAEFHCPVCRESPPIGEFWGCAQCRRTFDTFLTQGFCPHCNSEYQVTACPYCFNSRPMAEWRGDPAPTTPPQG